MTLVLMRHHRHLKKSRLIVGSVGLFSTKTVPSLPVMDRTSSLEHIGAKRSYPCMP